MGRPKEITTSVGRPSTSRKNQTVEARFYAQHNVYVGNIHTAISHLKSSQRLLETTKEHSDTTITYDIDMVLAVISEVIEECEDLYKKYKNDAQAFKYHYLNSFDFKSFFYKDTK